MRRPILAVASTVFALVLVMAAYVLISREATTAAGASVIPEDVAARLKKARIELASSSSAPGISEQTAINIASRHVPGGTEGQVTATYGLVTNDPGVVGSRLRMQGKPVWVVSFVGGTTARSGSHKSPLPKTFQSVADVLVDANTGTFVMAMEESTAPLAPATAQP